ncbi:CTD small phosphatase-like protein [Skeletonema marinoi]|uniref:protein-serine/threonine phosphatase n=1 Tax=Skeletonema marinoi TaxID=267567 RepID=A0AAD9DIV7_9STRA|nr:CTD small phosphatase-like protein [Skeletonema marinoi]
MMKTHISQQHLTVHMAYDHELTAAAVYNNSASDYSDPLRAEKALSIGISRTWSGDDENRLRMKSAQTPQGVRGQSDLRSPGMKKTPMAINAPKLSAFDSEEGGDHADDTNEVVIPDFITQTDRHGVASTPRSASAVQAARQMHPSGPEPNLHVEGGTLVEDSKSDDDDACESLLDSLRMMCCCFLQDSDAIAATGDTKDTHTFTEEDSALRNGNDPNRIKLLPALHSDDHGKKCLVLDLDETLVHSSFRAVQGADFVIPVQIEDVVHFVYVAKRPGVDEFLIEMAKHYEIVVYTASLNKYADPLLDLLDPQRVIRTRLFRESCVFYEGNYVKDMSLLNRDLSQAIIIDNSPSSYLFHPENAIDCGSFIDDPNDRELDQIGKFLVGIKDVEDVRGTANLPDEIMHNTLKIAVHHEKLWSLLGLDLKLSVGVPLIVEIAGFYKN